MAALEVIQGYLGPEGSVPAVAEYDELPDSTEEEE
jgi:hypothetical protein